MVIGLTFIKVVYRLWNSPGHIPETIVFLILPTQNFKEPYFLNNSTVTKAAIPWRFPMAPKPSIVVALILTKV